MLSLFLQASIIVIGLLVLSVPGFIVYSIITKKYDLLKILGGIFALLIAFPLGLLIELGTGGCCGSPDASSSNGSGYVLSVIIGVVGLIAVVHGVQSIKRRK